MAKNQAQPFELGCPCCGATMKVDPELKSVISHTPPPVKRTFNDMEEAAKSMREQDKRRETLFQQSVANEKNKSDLLEKKFQEAVRKAKETPDTGRPLRDFDLD
jgi:hypothetical protein